jgi:hypothetical protein
VPRESQEAEGNERVSREKGDDKPCSPLPVKAVAEPTERERADNATKMDLVDNIAKSRKLMLNGTIAVSLYTLSSRTNGYIMGAPFTHRASMAYANGYLVGEWGVLGWTENHRICVIGAQGFNWRRIARY